jgi:hypothetical protein
VTASLTDVHRRHLTILLPVVVILAASSLGAGCSTVDNDVSARVNDTELSPAGLTELVDVLAQGDVTNAEAIRNTLDIWVLIEIAGAQFEADGVELTDEELDAARSLLTGQLTGFDALGDSTQETLVDAQATLTVLDTLEDGQSFVELATANADIYIDPRFGQFHPVDGVIPLGVVAGSVDAPAETPAEG